MYTTEISRYLNAPHSAVYRALLDATAIATWRVPTGMSSQVHEFDAREGRAFRVSLTYGAPASIAEPKACLFSAWKSCRPRTPQYDFRFIDDQSEAIVLERN